MAQTNRFVHMRATVVRGALRAHAIFNQWLLPGAERHLIALARVARCPLPDIYRPHTTAKLR
jgi:hypothetical protein